MELQIFHSLWRTVPSDTRMAIERQFGVKRSGPSHVSDGKLVDTGNSDEDLKVLTVEKMQEFLGSAEGDIFKLFSMVVDKCTKKEISLAKVETPPDAIEQNGITYVRYIAPKVEITTPAFPTDYVKPKGKKSTKK